MEHNLSGSSWITNAEPFVPQNVNASKRSFLSSLSSIRSTSGCDFKGENCQIGESERYRWTKLGKMANNKPKNIRYPATTNFWYPWLVPKNLCSRIPNMKNDKLHTFSNQSSRNCNSIVYGLWLKRVIYCKSLYI